MGDQLAPPPSPVLAHELALTLLAYALGTAAALMALSATGASGLAIVRAIAAPRLNIPRS